MRLLMKLMLSVFGFAFAICVLFFDWLLPRPTVSEAYEAEKSFYRRF